MNKPLIISEGNMRPSAIAEAVGNYGAVEDGFVQVARGSSFFGPVKTVWTMPGSSNYVDALLQALEAGDIVVIDAGGNCLLSSLSYATMLQMQKKGVAGIIVNGTVEQYADIDMPIFAKSVSPKAIGTEERYRVGVPVVCGGACVLPGNYAAGNNDGILFLDKAEAERLMDNK